MSCIYETINLIHFKNNTNPYRYIGSDQNDDKKYFGSSKLLKLDIKKYGKENFKKSIIGSYDNISNVDLREIEKKMLIELDCAGNETYYNKTNTSHKGYTLTEDERINRKNQLRRSWKSWISSLPKDHEFFINNIKRMSEISKKIHTEEFWVSEHGEDIGKIKFENFKLNMSLCQSGEKNSMSKYSDESKLKAIDLFFSKKMKRKDICVEVGISYGVLKLIIRNYERYKIVSVKSFKK